MRTSANYFIYLLVVISITACGTTPDDPTLMAVQTHVSLTIEAQLAQLTETALIPTATPTIVATPEPTHTIQPTAFVFPTFAPTKLPEDVRASLVVENLEPFDGHNLRRISGWSAGFDGFTWMDAKHLFLYPITSKRYGDYVGKNAWFSYPTVINFDSGKVWLPPTEYKPFYRTSSIHYGLPKWSSQLAGLITQETETSVQLYSPDGDLLRTYQGLLAGVSPSGSKILLGHENPVYDLSAGSADVRWIDLLHSKEVVFHWPFPPESINGFIGYHAPIWSVDEMSVYAGHRLYGNAKNNESFLSTENMFDETITIAGFHSGGIWVLNNTYLVTRWNVVDEGMPRFIAFFDPAKKAYRNLTELAGLPKFREATVDTELVYPCENAWPDTTPGGRYVWVNCEDGGRLIDMQTFKAQIYPSYPKAILEWSADGTFAFVRDSDSDPGREILSAASNELKSIDGQMQCETWHPKQNIFVYLSAHNTEQMLIFVDAHSMLVKQQFSLPTTFHCPEWNKSGDQLILTAEDESLWQVDYPALSHLEQLTGSIQGMQNIALSPDGLSIAFSAGSDVYIVDVGRKP